MKIILLFVMISLVPVSAVAAKKQVVSGVGGTSIPQSSMVIDASYDNRLDALTPGYKVVSVVLVNQSFDIIYLDPENDEWSIFLDNNKKPVTALHDLRSQDPKSWSAIPEKAKNLMAYPLALPIGGREVIDIFVPSSVDVARFNKVSIFLKSQNTRYDILVRQ